MPLRAYNGDDVTHPPVLRVIRVAVWHLKAFTSNVLRVISLNLIFWASNFLWIFYAHLLTTLSIGSAPIASAVFARARKFTIMMRNLRCNKGQEFVSLLSATFKKKITLTQLAIPIRRPL